MSKRKSVMEKGSLPPRQKQERWVSKFGVAGQGSNRKYAREFQDLACDMWQLLMKLEPRMSPRDLHDVAQQAARTATGWLVAGRVNDNDNKRFMKWQAKRRHRK